MLNHGVGHSVYILTVLGTGSPAFARPILRPKILDLNIVRRPSVVLGSLVSEKFWTAASASMAGRRHASTLDRAPSLFAYHFFFIFSWAIILEEVRDRLSLRDLGGERDVGRGRIETLPRTRDSHQPFYGSLIATDVTWNKNLTGGVWSG